MNINSKEEVFALDIGTRSVVGIIIQKQAERKYCIVDYEIIEHENRAMYDGQIHNIDNVMKVVSQIKCNLEERNCKSFNSVAVAAAGRSLYTIKASAERNISPFYEITANDVLSLEWDAVRNALQQINKNYKKIDKRWDYHCIGYSVVNYKIDDQKIGSLIKQKGKKISIDLLATFLPRIVVDSLLTVIYKIGLELRSITLEPIAACHVAIPPGMRQLNVALVDIGAGTSDIAIAKAGSITAYGMVPVAGDEITEKLCEEYLLDYDTGEKVKRKLYTDNTTITFLDILGNNKTHQKDKIIENIDGTVEILAKKISEKIFDINGIAPNAVICIGGGSLTPKLTEKIAYHLGISKDRVRIRGSDIIASVSNIHEDIVGPFGVTPIGIAVNSLESGGLNMINVLVNDIEVQLFEFEDPTVVNALIQCGISPIDIYGAPGMALTFEINGQIKVVKGNLGEVCKIKVNGKEANINTILHNNDIISFVPGVKGQDAKVYIRDFISENHFKTIFVNDQKVEVIPDVYMNGERVEPGIFIEDGSKIMIQEKDMILIDVLNYISLDDEKISSKLIIRINGEEANFTSPVKDGDRVDIYYEESPF